MASQQPNRKDHEKHFNEDNGCSGRYATPTVIFGDLTTGDIEIEMCIKCGYIYFARCMHVKNSWNEEGTILTCDLCGVDGT